MITGLRVETKGDDTRVMRAIKERRSDQYQYLVEFTPNRNSLNRGGESSGKTILNSAGQNDPNLISFSFKLRRGLYDVTITRVAEIQGREIKTVPETKEKYPDPVMVGEKYVVKSKIEDAQCYGVNGVRVRIKSTELELDSHTDIYIIDRENLREIKYYVPFNGSDRIDFSLKE